MDKPKGFPFVEQATADGVVSESKQRALRTLSVEMDWKRKIAVRCGRHSARYQGIPSFLCFSHHHRRTIFFLEN